MSGGVEAASVKGKESKWGCGGVCACASVNASKRSCCCRVSELTPPLLLQGESSIILNYQGMLAAKAKRSRPADAEPEEGSAKKKKK